MGIFENNKMVGVLPLRFISVLFFVIFNLAVPSNQAKLTNEGSDGDFQESKLPHLFESMLTKLSTEMMKNIENIRNGFRNWNIIKDTDSSVSTNEGIGSFFVDSNLNGDFTEPNDEFTETLEEFETIKNMDMIMDSDNLESTNSKMEPFADDLNINDDFYLDLMKDSDNVESTDSKMGPFADDSNIMDDYYLTKADWKIYGDCIVNSCMTMVRPGGEEFSFKQGLNKRACIISCVCKDPPKSWRPRKIVFAICCFGILLSILYMFAKCEAKGEKYFKKRKEQRIIKKLKVLSQKQFSDSDDSDDEEENLKNPGKTLEKVYHVPASSKDNFKNF